MTPRLTLLTGGVRSGKSARALHLARQRAGSKPVLFAATAQAFDDEMRDRIATHRSERPDHWTTLEEPITLAERLAERLRNEQPPYGLVIIDCLTLWVSNLLLALPDDADAEPIIAAKARDLIAVLAAVSATTPALVVTNEVGLGVVPPTPLGRRYRDALGRANQLVAAAADEVILLVSGIDVVIKGGG
jgi:adenosylcobinamide kinase/adenosylcobinamide-phosphate guanylyltransferase